LGSRRDRINNEKARRREAKVYNENLQKEVAALLKLYHSEHQQMAIALYRELDANEKERLRIARLAKGLSTRKTGCWKSMNL